MLDNLKELRTPQPRKWPTLPLPNTQWPHLEAVGLAVESSWEFAWESGLPELSSPSWPHSHSLLFRTQELLQMYFHYTDSPPEAWLSKRRRLIDGEPYDLY